MKDEAQLKLVECPRDAMQGWKHLIPTHQKIAYIQQLLSVGFHTIDFGSFVSSRAIPQMADTTEVLAGLDLSQTKSRLLAIVANTRGAAEAAAFEQIAYIGFPFSVSETFQQRNTHSSIAESFRRVEEIQGICQSANKQLVVYISMGFGNPYGDPYSEEIVFEWVNKLIGLDISIISLADTVGLALPSQVYNMTEYLVDSMPGIEIGVHLHSTAVNWQEKLEAAWKAGARRIDGAIRGIGGCPMANDELVGNMATEKMVNFFHEHAIETNLDMEQLVKSITMAGEVFV